MHRPIRKQGDGKGDDFSRAAAQDLSTPSEGDAVVRSEFAKQTDINEIVTKFGITGVQQHTARYGDAVNYDLDLAQAIQAVDDAQKAYNRLPEHVRGRYHNIEQLLTAAESGELSTLEQPQEPPVDATVPPTQ